MRSGRGDTIFAVASGLGRSAVAVVRVSGSAASEAGRALLGDRLPPPRRASLRRLSDQQGSYLDDALVIWMPGPASFTGEDQIELQIHGGLAVRAAVLRALSDVEGLRPAEAGEFARRAFLNGRIDLAEAEGLADLIDAETEMQRRQALQQMGGALSSGIAAWRASLVNALAGLEAALDFSDEEDVSSEVDARAMAAIKSVRAAMSAVLSRGGGERVREGYVVVLAGPPNAGKSTLLNAIAGRDVAIVSDIPGTTRDLIEVRCDLGGWPVTFVDTAGMHEAIDAIERLGIERARERAREADLVAWLRPADDPAADADLPHGLGRRVMTVVTKTDLIAGDARHRGGVSAMTGEGVEAFLEGIEALLTAEIPAAEGMVLTRERHRVAASEAAASLARAEAQQHNGGQELIAEDVRLALRSLGRIVGDVDVEEVLDRIFAQFCIGK